MTPCRELVRSAVGLVLIDQMLKVPKRHDLEQLSEYCLACVDGVKPAKKGAYGTTCRKLRFQIAGIANRLEGHTSAGFEPFFMPIYRTVVT